MTLRKVMLSLPRFQVTWGCVNLRDQLAALGMPAAFDPSRADFSGINDPTSLFLSGVFHKAFVEVTEEGTEAAAATAMTFRLTGLLSLSTERLPIFRADHPFLFAIRDRKSGAILFLGRVTDPTQGS